MRRKLLVTLLLMCMVMCSCGKNSDVSTNTNGLTPTPSVEISDDEADKPSPSVSVEDNNTDINSNDNEKETNDLIYYDQEFIDNFERTENTKLVAITIDDGPDGAGTDDYLEIIKENDIKATFFVVGKNIDSHSDQLIKMVEAGCEIGNHSYNHGYLNGMTVDEINNEITSTNEAIQSVLPEYPVRTVRAPYFAYSDEMTSSIEAPLIDCSKSEKDKDYDKTLEELINASDGDVILLHAWNDSSKEALKTAIPTLKEEGFVFVTVSELFALQKQEPVNGVVYRNIAYNSADEYQEVKVLFEGEGYSDGDWSAWQPAVTLDKDDIKEMTAGTAIKVEYKSSSAPAMVLQSFNGGSSWCQFESSFTDGKSAYFTYEDIIDNFEDNALCDAAYIYPWGAEITVTRVSFVKAIE